MQMSRSHIHRFTYIRADYEWPSVKNWKTPSLYTLIDDTDIMMNDEWNVIIIIIIIPDL